MEGVSIIFHNGSFFYRSVLDCPHVIWLDNYAHILRVNMPTGSTGWWRNALWTAKAAITLESLKDSEGFRKDVQFTGMPSLTQIFNTLVLARFRKFYIAQEQKDFNFYDLSFSKDMRRIPIKPETKEARQADLDRKFVPLGILGHNIGSNSGLIKLLMDLRVEEEHKPHVPALLLDCNIYWRVMKVSFLMLCLPLLIPFVSFSSLLLCSFSDGLPASALL